METENFSKDRTSSPRAGTEPHDPCEFTFHADLRFLDTWRLDEVAWDGSESRFNELIDIGRVFSGSDIHVHREFFRDDVHHELLCRFNVVQRVFVRAVFAYHCGEKDDRRIGANTVEKTEWREVPISIGTDGGNESDRSWNDGADHELVDVVVVVIFWIDGQGSGSGRFEVAGSKFEQKQGKCSSAIPKTQTSNPSVIFPSSSSSIPSTRRILRQGGREWDSGRRA